jgi:hypothetical protein
MNNWQNRIFSPGPLLQLELKFSAHEAFPFPKAVAGLRGYDLLEGGKRPCHIMTPPHVMIGRVLPLFIIGPHKELPRRNWPDVRGWK